ncbi:MAG: hydroxyisourate hydrolase [bacterium]
MRSPITTHVLDTASGRPARAVMVVLERLEGTFREVAKGITNEDGRIADMLPPGEVPTGTYRISFDTGAYYRAQGLPVFYPSVSITFEVDAADEHYHVPLLLSPYGYSTYRGS